LHGHLKNEQAAKDGQTEEDGSSGYVNPDKSKDTQLNYALDLVRGVRPPASDGSSGCGQACSAATVLFRSSLFQPTIGPNSAANPALSTT
jgi:hypothetical protein